VRNLAAALPTSLDAVVVADNPDAVRPSALSCASVLAGEDAFRLCLLRTLKTATHETGHMFSMHHCTAYECNMCGSNHREESDRRPLWCCPQCAAKTCWATRTDMAPRYLKLLAFARANALTAEAEFFAKSIRALGGNVPPATQPITK